MDNSLMSHFMLSVETGLGKACPEPAEELSVLTLRFAHPT